MSPFLFCLKNYSKALLTKRGYFDNLSLLKGKKGNVMKKFMIFKVCQRGLVPTNENLYLKETGAFTRIKKMAKNDEAYAVIPVFINGTVNINGFQVG